MISDQTAKALNGVMGSLYADAYALKGVACFFAQDNLPGFACFANNESKERWEIGDWIRKSLELYKQPVTMVAIPGAKTSFPNMTPDVILGEVKARDEKIMQALRDGMKLAQANGDFPAIDFMSAVFDRMAKETNEVSLVKNHSSLVGIPGIPAYDAHLKSYYKDRC